VLKSLHRATPVRDLTGNLSLITRHFSLVTVSGFIAAALLCFLWGCTPAVLPSGSSAVRIEEVPFFPQDEYQCGPASLAGVMNYWKVPVTPDEIAREIFSRTARGTLTMDMVRYAEKKGLSALQYRGSWEDLRKKVREGFPLVVLIDGGFSLYQANHYMVVTGFDDRGVIVNSGEREQAFMELTAFLPQWERAGFWTLLVSPGKG
jgi:ABC-type bacteriocin/lantibiotic exporter with double-glycine peptidase domain